MTADRPLPRRHFLGRALAALATGAWFGRVVRPEPAEGGSFDSPYTGEIRMFAGWYAPAGWAFCDGQLLSVDDFSGLYSLIGTTYGGDGVVTFALPDLRGRAPIHYGLGPGLSNRTQGEAGGNESVTLTVSQIPAHSHVAGAGSANGTSDSPAGLAPARSAAGVPQYGTTANATFASGALLATGGSQPHDNHQPYVGINFIICLDGTFPSPF